MFNITREEMEWAGRKLVLETGKVARQADGAVMATYGGTTVLCTVVAQKEANPDVDFFPLSVHYQEKTFAVGKIPGGFLRREGRPSDAETLKSRLIDRPIRPLFPEGFRNEVQIICTVLAYDFESDTDIAALIGASAALAISGVPFQGPVGAAKVGYINKKFVLNPTPDAMKDSGLDLVVAGTKEGVLMVESEAKELPEDVMLGAVEFGHESFQPVLKLIEKLAKKAGKTPWELPTVAVEATDIAKKVAKIAEKDLRKAYNLKIKQDRYAAIDAAKQKVTEELAQFVEINPKLISSAFKDLQSAILRGDILNEQKRLDGRGLDDIRPIIAEVGVLPRAHGSALFTRGETQALVVATLGTGQDEQIIDALEGEYKERFLLHYNFPPYSVGEVGRLGGVGRREIGHGKLAWRAINPLIPSKEQFAYTLRVVSEITESNGSSSMATVCGTSLALMDAGTPLAKPIAGIAMGLIKEGKKYAVLSDILGDEDHLGDMDFKVAGTSDGITALQMDIKITSITAAIMKEALAQAKKGRLHILKEMSKAIEYSRGQLSTYAPKMATFKINPSKIREVIGSGGKVIREICETSGAKVDIEDDGQVTVAGVAQEAIDMATKMIQNIACDPEVGHIYEGKVVKVAEFGAFVNFMGRDGLVHISELAPTRVNKTEDIVKLGDIVQVKVLGFDDRGKIKLSMKAVNQD
ncbi:MAG: polyribonucleotide nucleotidyltransferase [Pseudomonadota bacterium]|jgi:polyribonucleotide nucleotidyltransferase|nr:polyribonucleotide nucleotidyltransferase [Alphaproteobacteria bacterium]